MTLCSPSSIHCIVICALVHVNAVQSLYDRSSNVLHRDRFSKERPVFPSSATWTVDELLSLTATIRNKTSHRKLMSTKLDHLLSNLINDGLPATANSSRTIFRMVGDKILVDVVGSSGDEITTALELGGYKSNVIGCHDRMCSMYVALDRLEELAALPQVLSIRAATPIRQQAAGRVIGEGYFATYVDKAIKKHTVNGAGITIGVLSDSFDCLKQARDDARSRNLPSLSKITVLADLDPGEECFSGIDEGRAMMQLIYDVAPGARLAFRTAVRGIADFANGIRELANFGCDIIVDDIGYPNDAFFQDGLIAQSVDTVVMQGVSYFSAVGNDARNAWDATDGFILSEDDDEEEDEDEGAQFHEFGKDKDGNPIVSQQIIFSGRTEFIAFIFQWDQPHFSVSGGLGCRNNVDIFFTYNKTVVGESLLPNEGSDPFEVVVLFPEDFGIKGEDFILEMFIVLVSGEAPGYMKLLALTSDNVFFEFGNGSTIYGHPNAASAGSVGAVSYLNTPSFNVTPPLIAPYSSVGGTPILIDKFGNRQDKEIRRKPIVSGPDGSLTTLESPLDRFFGSSAAAPHVAAVAALLLQAKGGPKTIVPKDLYGILQRTAIDMDDPSTVSFDFDFDFKTGFGLVNALEALDAVRCNTSWNLFNSRIDAFVAPLVNNTVVSNPPPCNSTNIQLVVPCGTSRPVVIELYRGNRLLRRQTEYRADYFLFGNRNKDVDNGRIVPGAYSIRAMIDGVFTPRVRFTLRGSSAC